MAVKVPSYQDLYNSIINDLKNKFGIIQIIGKSFLSIFAAVLAGKQKMQYITISQVERNIYPDTSDEESLRRAGRLFLGRDVMPASAGEYTVTVTGEINGEIPINSTFADSRGYLFVNDSSFTFVTTSGSITLRALTPGSESSLKELDILQLTSKIINVNSFATVTSVDVTPTEAETIDEYRDKVIQSYRLQPQGGARGDYRLWTESVAGIRTVYPYATSGAVGEIDLYVEAFPADSDPVETGIPTAALLNDVKDSIEPYKIPLTVVEIHYLPIVPLDVDVIITDLSDAGKLGEITDAIRNYLYDIRPFVAGVDLISEQYKGRLYASELIRLIIETGVTFTDVEVQVDSTPITIYTFTKENIPYLNSVS